MSIIQDALRRREEEQASAQARLSTPSIGTAPRPVEKKGPMVSPVLLVLLVVVLAGGGAFWHVRLRSAARPSPRPVARRSDVPTAQRPPAVVPSAPVDGVSARAMAAAGIAAPTSAAPDRATDAGGATPPRAEPATSGSGSSAAAPTTAAGPAQSGASPSPGSQSTPMGAVGREAEVEPPIPSAETPPTPPPVWPRFHVKGVVMGRAGSGSVILDRGIVEVGQTMLDGVRVVGVEGEVAVMEFQGEQRRFRVGSSSP